MKHLRSLAAISFGMIAFLTVQSSESAMAAVIAPDLLVPAGSTPLPNGDSSSTAIPESTLFDRTETFSFSALSGSLRERVISYSDAPSVDHPGLYFDYEVQLTSGSLSSVGISGYSTFATSVKECGISNCGGSGANGVLADSASRSASGDLITFNFGTDLTAGEHSANLQTFVDAPTFADPLAILTDAAGDTFSLEAVAPAVPEPSTWATMILGFIAVGFMAHRRNRMPLNAA